MQCSRSLIRPRLTCRQTFPIFKNQAHAQLIFSKYTSKMALPISSPSPRLDRFEQAMESLYDSFTSIIEPADWNPPPRSGGHRGRYLWTDAFGVINLLTMHSQYKISTKPEDWDKRYLILAERLVHTVHNVLGRTRDGDSRLPGATDTNPLGGGLRIGKTDDHGPDADGQYHHYLTLWMFALNRMARASGNMEYNRQAVQLAKAVHPKFFIDRTTARPRMVWKMDIDLTKALVASEGNLDPIDGYVVFRLLQASAVEAGDGEVLAEEISDYRRVMNRKGEHYVSSDPLDLGMTLWTTHWFSEREAWAAELSKRCFEQTYNLFEVNHYLERNIKFRLAFREFGTCMGIECQAKQAKEKELAVDLKTFSAAIIAAWDPYMELTIADDLTPEDLRPITRVMYAAALIPGAFQSGFLGPEAEPVPEK